MKTKGLLAAVLACTLVAGISVPGLVHVSAEEASPQLGAEMFPCPGFDGMLLEGEETYTLSETQREKTGTLNADSPAVAKKEGDNVYLELKYDGSRGFASIFSMMRLTEGGDYQVSMRLRKHEGFVTTDNFGFRFYDNGIDSKGWENEINAAEANEWFTLTETYNVPEANLSKIDSFSMWFNTMGNTANVLDMDDISIRRIIPEEDAPEAVGGASKIWREESAADVEFTLDLKGAELTKVMEKESEYELEEGEYTFDAASGKLTIDSGYVKSLGEGDHTLVAATANGSVELVITVYLKTATIPETTEGYELVATMLGGDFESYDIGLTFSDAQTDEAWGSLANYDDPGVIVDDNGNHVLRLGRKEGSEKTFSSAFCMTAPEIGLGDIVTLKFSYKFVGEIASGNTNVCFVGASNTAYHEINLITKPAQTNEGNANVAKWDIKYTDGENGYTNVEMSFIVDFSFLNATNSLRFLYNIQGESEVYIDNVSLDRWVEEGSENAEIPEVTETAATFNGASPADLVFHVDLKEYKINTLKEGTATVAAANYTLTENDTVLTLKKEYLSTLTNGSHTFKITTLGGECTFTVTVSGNIASNPPATGGDGGGLSTGAIAGIVIAAVAAVAIVAAVIVVVKKKKH